MADIGLPLSEKYETRVTRISVLPNKEPIFSEKTTHIEICDDGAGEFVRISQEGGHTDYAKWITIELDEWIVLKPAIDFLMKECR
jgi:hypothetical protein